MDIKHMNKTVRYGFMVMGVFAIIFVIGIISLIMERRKEPNNIANDIVIENIINE